VASTSTSPSPTCLGVMALRFFMAEFKLGSFPVYLVFWSRSKLKSNPSYTATGALMAGCGS
jgi:hypothetical protein